MSASGGGPAIKQVLHPPSPAGLDGQAAAPKPARPGRLPGTRRPIMLLLAVALAGAGILGSVALARSADHRVPVVVVTVPVPAGAPIAASDLGTAPVAAGAGVSEIPARQLGQVPGHIAARSLTPGMLLVPADLTTRVPPAPGQQIVVAPVKPQGMPADGLAPGTHVQIVATPGQAGQAGSSAVPSPAAIPPVAAIVQAVNAAPNQDGFDQVNLLVASGQAAAVARLLSTGQFALDITSRNP